MAEEYKTTLADGSLVTPDHREINPATGQQKGYEVIAKDERIERGFQRPVRQTYRHLSCDGETTMALPIAQTFAVDPTFYEGTFCLRCKQHFLLAEFIWSDDGTPMGS